MVEYLGLSDILFPQHAGTAEDEEDCESMIEQPESENEEDYSMIAEEEPDEYFSI